MRRCMPVRQLWRLLIQKREKSVARLGRKPNVLHLLLTPIQRPRIEWEQCYHMGLHPFAKNSPCHFAAVIIVALLLCVSILYVPGTDLYPLLRLQSKLQYPLFE